MEIKSSNPNAFKDLIQRIKDIDGAQTRVGWFESAVYEGGRPVAAVAAGNELGIPSRSIPARPFMRPTVMDKQSAWANVAAGAAKQVMAGKITAHDAMDLIGLVAESDVAETIAGVMTPPLSPITIAARAYRKKGKQVTGKTIGEIAGKLKSGEGVDVSGVSTKPLNDTGLMISTLTHVTENT